MMRLKTNSLPTFGQTVAGRVLAAEATELTAYMNASQRPAIPYLYI